MKISTMTFKRKSCSDFFDHVSLPYQRAATLDHSLKMTLNCHFFQLFWGYLDAPRRKTTTVSSCVPSWWKAIVGLYLMGYVRHLWHQLICMRTGKVKWGFQRAVKETCCPVCVLWLNSPVCKTNSLRNTEVRMLSKGILSIQLNSCYSLSTPTKSPQSSPVVSLSTQLCIFTKHDFKSLSWPPLYLIWLKLAQQ